MFLVVTAIDCVNQFEFYSDMASQSLSNVSYSDIALLGERESIGDYQANELIETLELWGVLPP